MSRKRKPKHYDPPGRFGARPPVGSPLRCPDSNSTVQRSEMAGAPSIHVWHDPGCPTWGERAADLGVDTVVLVARLVTDREQKQRLIKGLETS